MITLKKVRLLATLGAMLVPAATLAAPQAINNDTVKDERGTIVTNTFGNCVLTKWSESSTDCVGGQPGGLAKLTKEMRSVYFDFNKSTLNASEKKKLDEVAKILKGAKEVESVDIVGFADSIGNDGYNQKLSKNRAGAVRSYLAAKGLKTRNVRVDGKGEGEPVTSCDDKQDKKDLIACLAADRRVEIMVNLKK